MPRLQVTLSEELHAEMLAFAAARGRSASSWAAEILVGAVRRRGEPARQQPNEPDEGEKEAVRAWLTPSEMAELATRAEEAAQKKGTWAAMALRGVLAGEPQLSEAEAVEIRRASEDLAALARALRAFTDASAAAGRAPTLTDERLGQIEAEVRENIDVLVDVLEASRQRWRLLR